MTRYKHSRSLGGVFGFALSAALMLVSASGQINPTQQPELPHGNYSVSIKPFLGAGYESLPVLVTSVTSELDKGIGATIVAIENGTSRRLDAVRLTWYLSSADNPGLVLRQGRTPLLGIPDGIKPGDVERLQYPVVSFAKVHKPLLRNGSVNGSYVIQIAVSEARFDDGTTQTFLASKRGRRLAEATFVKAAYRRTSPVAQTFCPGEACQAVRETGDSGTGPILGYNCGAASPGSTCTNAAGGQSCTNTVCGRSGGGGNPPKQPIQP